MADTLRNHHGIRHLKLPERVADQFVFESLAEQDLLISNLPGDDISGHPGNIYASNPWMNKSPLMVRRIYMAGKLDKHPRLKQAAEHYLVIAGEGIASWVQQPDGSFVFRLRDSVNGPAGG